MNERREPPHDMLDDVAVYALGALPAADARRVREHIAACSLCAQEYELLRPATMAIGLSAETRLDARAGPGPLLKRRILAKIRTEKSGAGIASVPAPGATRRPATENSPLWPAYLVAAACVAIAIASSLWNVALTGQLKQAQRDRTQAMHRSTSLASDLAAQRSTLSDLLGADAKHYVRGEGEVVTRGARLYVTLHDVAELPRGKVYQAWTLPKGATKVVPSLTFVPDAHGVAVVALPPDARTTAAVAVSVEPEGGSKQPTTKPILLIPLT